MLMAVSIILVSWALAICIYVIALRLASRETNKKSGANADKKSVLFTSEAAKYRGDKINKLSIRVIDIALKIAKKENVRLIDIPMMERAFQKLFEEEIAGTDKT